MRYRVFHELSNNRSLVKHRKSITESSDIEHYYTYFFIDDFIKWIEESDAHIHEGEGVFIFYKSLKENLEHIKEGNIKLFHTSIAFTVLLDQLMYTYFKSDYSDFQKLTNYPKLEHKIYSKNVKPWNILPNNNQKLFEKCSKFFINEYKKFFENNKFKEATWKNVVNAMLKDKDISSSEYGEIFIKQLNIYK